jgi:phosphatidylinositol alpha-1,6-mannosyltransferase
LRAAPPDLLVAMNWEPAAGILELGWSGPWGAFAHGRDVTANLAPEARTQRRDQTVRATPQWWVLTRWLRLELEARGVPGARVREVPAAVPGPMVAPPWERPRHGRPLVLSVGRLVARKGHGRLVAAWPYIDSRADLVIVGDGPERPALQAQVRALGLADRVRVAGAVAESEVERLRREAALFALPARQGSDGDTEGYGLVYLEAAAWGLPSLGCRTAGAAEAILDGRTGIQLPEDADPATIAAAIDGALASEERRLVLARGAWNRWDRGHRPRHLAHAIVDGARPWGPRE